MNLRAAVGDIKLTDARHDREIVQFLTMRGFNLDEGMAVIYGDKIYFGDDAITFISSITIWRPFIGKLIARVLKNKRRAGFLYPIMKAGRRVTLSLLGISLI